MKVKNAFVHVQYPFMLIWDQNIFSLREQTYLEKKIAEKENYLEQLNDQMNTLSMMVCYAYQSYHLIFESTCNVFQTGPIDYMYG